MSLPVLSPHRRTAPLALPRQRSASSQRGVVLIIAMILLLVISLLAITSVRNVASSEKVLGNARTTQLALESAEIALRHCEASVREVISVASGNPSAYATTFTASNILPTATTPQWSDLGIWDGSSSDVYVAPLSLVNQTGTVAITAYQRPPECMVVPLPVVLTGSTDVSTTASFVVTARGFGPEVPALSSSTRIRPVGTEIWLQSQFAIPY